MVEVTSSTQDLTSRSKIRWRAALLLFLIPFPFGYPPLFSSTRPSSSRASGTRHRSLSFLKKTQVTQSLLHAKCFLADCTPFLTASYQTLVQASHQSGEQEPQETTKEFKSNNHVYRKHRHNDEQPLAIFISKSVLAFATIQHVQHSRFTITQEEELI